VYRADNPLGPFEDIADGAISPRDWDAIDGTLYIDGQNNPWLVFVHEWTSMPDHNGSMVAGRLSEDFTKLISEPIHLFYAKDPVWATSGVTDGPYLYREDDGTLMMIWSNFSEKGYVVAQMRSQSGEIQGPWEQAPLLYQKDLCPVFTADGGHGMIFQRNDGVFMLSLHSPQHLKEGEFEKLLLLEVEDSDGCIKLK
jgi:beta-xylosidase